MELALFPERLLEDDTDRLPGPLGRLPRLAFVQPAPLAHVEGQHIMAGEVATEDNQAEWRGDLELGNGRVVG